MAVIPERPASAFFQKASTPTPMGETTPRPVTTTRSSRPDEDENIGVRRGLFAPAALGPSGLTVEDIRVWSGLFAPAALGPSGLRVEAIRLWSGLFAPAAPGASVFVVAVRWGVAA